MKKILFWVVLMALITGLGYLIFANLSSPGALIGELDENSVIVAFGNSITYGTGTDPDRSYPTVLADLLGIKVINEGVPGELISQGRKRLPRVLDKYLPQLVILCEGGNDILRGRPEQEIASDLREMLKILRDRGVDVILLGVPRLDITLEPADLYSELAEEFQVLYEGKILKRILANGLLKSDQIHPNAAGYFELASTLAELIERHQ